MVFFLTNFRNSFLGRGGGHAGKETFFRENGRVSHPFRAAKKAGWGLCFLIFVLFLAKIHSGTSFAQEVKPPQNDAESTPSGSSVSETPPTRPKETPSATSPKPETTPPRFPFSAGTPPLSSLEGIPVYLMNREGRLVVMPGVTLEKLDQIVRTGHGILPEKPVKTSPLFPEYLIHSMQGIGRIEKDFARLKMTFRMETFQETPVRIPLYFDEGVLEGGNVLAQISGESTKNAGFTENTETPNLPDTNSSTAVLYRGSGNVWLEFQQGGGGFIAWVTGKGFHELELTFLVPVRRLQEENQLRLQLPSATMSELKFEMPQTRAEYEMLKASVSEGGILISPSFVPERKTPDAEDKTPDAENKTPGISPLPAGEERGITQINILQLKNDFRLSWNAPEKKEENSQTVLEVDGLIQTTIEKTEILYHTILKVAIHGAPTDRFWVYLPAGAELQPSFSPIYTVTAPAEFQGEKPGDSDGRLSPKTAENPGENEPVLPGNFAGEKTEEEKDVSANTPSSEDEDETLLNTTFHKTASPFAEIASRQKPRTVVEVRLNEKTSGIVRVDIFAKVSQEMTTYSEWLDLGGFNVPGASRQTGYYAIKSNTGRYPLWAPGAGVRHVDALPASLELWGDSSAATADFTGEMKDDLPSTASAGETEDVSGEDISEASSPDAIPGAEENTFSGSFPGGGDEKSVTPSGGGVNDTLKTAPGTTKTAAPQESSGATSSRPSGVPKTSPDIPSGSGTDIPETESRRNGGSGFSETSPSSASSAGTGNPSAGTGNVIPRNTPETSPVKNTDSGSGSGFSSGTTKTAGTGSESLSGTSPGQTADLSRTTPADGLNSPPKSTSLPPEKPWDAVFEYASQPMTLFTRLITRSVRLNVEPEYVVTVTENEILLKGTWKCFIRGGKITWIDMDFGDWVFDSISPDNLILLESLEVDATGRMSIPLIQPTGGNLTFTFHARRKIREMDAAVEFSLPRPAANQAMPIMLTVTPANLRVQSAENVELTPDAEKIRHLTRLPQTTDGQITSGTPSALFYRSENPDTVFAAARKIHPQTILVRQLSRLEILPDEYHVYQTYEYTVSYAPIRQLKYTLPEVNVEKMDVFLTQQAPASLSGEFFSETNNGSVLRNGESAASGFSDSLKTSGRASYIPLLTRQPIVKINPFPPGVSENRGMDITVLLPEEKTGVFYVTFHYAVPMKKMAGPGADVRHFMLGTAKDGTLQDNRLQVYASDFIRILSLSPEETQKMSWKEVSSAAPAGTSYSEMISSVILDGIDFVQRHLREKGKSEILGTSAEPSARAPAPGVGMRTSPDGRSGAERLPAETSAAGRESLSRETGLRHSETVSPDFYQAAPIFVYLAPAAEDRISLSLELKENDPLTVTVIDRFWLQTWMTGNIRQDRAVFLFPPMTEPQAFPGGAGSRQESSFRFAADGVSPEISRTDGVFSENANPVNSAYTRKFTIQLPQGASADEAEVWIDRRPAEMDTQVKRLSANSLQVILQPTRRNMPRTVEICYQFTKSIQTEESLRTEVPHVVEATWIRGMYWQVVLPGNTHILTAPPGFSMEYRWGWNQFFFWGRIPLWEQPSLERWSGALQGAPAPTTMNRYVFAGMGSRDTLKDGVSLRMINRTTLVIFLAIIVFLCGFTFIHFPRTYHPVTLLILLVLVGGIGIRYPDLALLALQASSLGVLLVITSMLFNLFNRSPAHRWRNGSTETKTTITQSPRMAVTAGEEERGQGSGIRGQEKVASGQ